MKKLNKKVFKGMTLVEIIVAIAVLAIMTTVLVAASKAIQSYLRSSKDINDRVAVQAPVAQAGDVDAASEMAEEVQIFIIPTIGQQATIPLSGKVYAVYDNDEMEAHENEAGGELNMKFITHIETTTRDPEAVLGNGSNGDDGSDPAPGHNEAEDEAGEEENGE